VGIEDLDLDLDPLAVIGDGLEVLSWGGSVVADGASLVVDGVSTVVGKANKAITAKRAQTKPAQPEAGTESTQAAEPATPWNCPACGAFNSARATFCSLCAKPRPRSATE